MRSAHGLGGGGEKRLITWVWAVTVQRAPLAQFRSAAATLAKVRRPLCSLSVCCCVLEADTRCGLAWPFSGCPANTYANLGVLTGSTACLNCSVNFDTAGAVSSTACTGTLYARRRPHGAHVSRLTRARGTRISSLPCGLFQRRCGGRVRAVCGGHLQPDLGVVVPGYAREQTHAGAVRTWTQSWCLGVGILVCSPNTYSLSGSSGCTLCPAGTDTRGAGRAGSAAACQPCAAGFFSLGTGDSCVACPTNTYSASGSTTGATACNVCPAGKDTNGGTAKTDVSDCIGPCGGGERGRRWRMKEMCG
jgi:hypothetical protein